MDTYYQYIDGKKWGFWNKLDGTIRKVVGQLTETDKSRVVAICHPDQAKYFNLI
ncbi:hypothetical protein D9M69_698500 [compost metagenome]